MRLMPPLMIRPKGVDRGLEAPDRSMEAGRVQDGTEQEEQE